jgi:hypothetical protein
MSDEATRLANLIQPPKCPKCGAVIRSLNYYEKAWNRALFMIHVVRSDGRVFYSPEYYDWDTVEVIEGEYRCPECGEVLFTSEEEAEDFLTGEVDDDDED